jgi:hypothetical protein
MVDEIKYAKEWLVSLGYNLKPKLGEGQFGKFIMLVNNLFFLFIEFCCSEYILHQIFKIR